MSGRGGFDTMYTLIYIIMSERVCVRVHVYAKCVCRVCERRERRGEEGAGGPREKESEGGNE